MGRLNGGVQVNGYKKPLFEDSFYERVLGPMGLHCHYVSWRFPSLIPPSDALFVYKMERAEESSFLSLHNNLKTQFKR